LGVTLVPRVGLYATSPRCAVGFPLQSLTQTAVTYDLRLIANDCNALAREVNRNDERKLTHRCKYCAKYQVNLVLASIQHHKQLRGILITSFKEIIELTIFYKAKAFV